MNDVSGKAISDFKNSGIAFTKFITANDTGKTGGHQYGFHIHKEAWKLFFKTPGIKGTSKDIFITIKWQDDFETDSRFVFYGKKTRNEYRITQFGRGFPFLHDEYTGDLLVICKTDNLYYKAYVISGDDQIENFLSGVGIPITDIGQLHEKKEHLAKSLENLIKEIVAGVDKKFPSSAFISGEAERIFFEANTIHPQLMIDKPDEAILCFMDTEYKLFQAIERKFGEGYLKGFKDLPQLISVANSFLQRRKSRAGRSFENHLSSIFNINKIQYDKQVTTEGRKKPDFIFPGAKAYHSKKFKTNDLIFLAAKTTCKDRWRQILNEADRIKTKHLVTLQPGISRNQLDEMKKHNVRLVIPETNRGGYPKEYKHELLSLQQFIHMVKKIQA